MTQAEPGEERRTVWSEGSRLAAVVLKPPGAVAPAPAVLLCHGWGGLKEHLVELYAREYVRAGLIAMAFDYRGWGGSDGKLIPAVGTPPLVEPGERTMAVCVVREVVDPREQVDDVRNCLAYLLSEEGVDPGRVGLFGTSYGAGHVVSVAGTDERVKAVVAQIGGYGHPKSEEFKELARRRMAEKARGLMDPPIPQGVDGYPTLKGTPDVARQLGHSPLAYAEGIRVPTLVIDAEQEEYNTPTCRAVPCTRSSSGTPWQSATCSRAGTTGCTTSTWSQRAGWPSTGSLATCSEERGLWWASRVVAGSRYQGSRRTNSEGGPPGCRPLSSPRSAASTSSRRE